MTEGVKTYRFLSLVGEGGFGRVYRARMEAERGFHKDVAIKVLNDPNPAESLLQQFRDEAKMLALVRDRAFVGVEPPIQLDGRWAVVMEFVDGVSCSAMVQRKRLPPGVAVEIVGEVARALDNAVHMEGPEGGPLNLIHRDIKPDNVQVTPAGEVRLLDFGIAKANFSAREYSTRRSIGGTPGYIAPERLRGVEVPAGDVYSLGALLHTLVTGRAPRFAQTVRIGDDDMPIVPEEPEFDVSDGFLRDPDVLKVLTLASWMCAEDHEERPTASQVEEVCGKLRQVLPPPSFRHWAQLAVPHRHELEPDDRIGQVHTVTHFSSTLSDTRTLDDAGSGIAIGALLGGGAALAAAAAVLVVVGVVGAALYLWSQELGEPVVPAHTVVAPSAPPAAAGDTGVEKAEVPVVAADPTPPAVPTAPPSPGPLVIRVDAPVAPSAPPPVSSAPRPDAPSTAGPTGLVIIQTVPSGATVRERGRVLAQEGRGYVLSVGSHVLDVVSPRGETTRIPVLVRRDDPVEICYSFDTNSACADTP